MGKGADKGVVVTRGKAAKATAEALANPPAKPSQATQLHAEAPDKRLNFFFGWSKSINASPLFLFEGPIFAVLAYTTRAHFQTWMLGYMFLIYLWKECVPMSMILHRYFSHKGYKANRVVQFGLYLLGCMASQGPPLWWASKHRKHHKNCDSLADPHSPVARSKMDSYIGWIWTPGREGPVGVGHDTDYIEDLLACPELVYMENFSSFVPAACHLATYYAYGPGEAVYISLLSGVVCQYLTLAFNVAFHEPDPAKMGAGGVQAAVDAAQRAVNGADNPECHARDLPWDPLSNIFGEAYHAWHHVHPRAHWRPGLDLPYFLFLWPMLQLGIVSGENIMGATKGSKLLN